MTNEIKIFFHLYFSKALRSFKYKNPYTFLFEVSYSLIIPVLVVFEGCSNDK